MTNYKHTTEEMVRTDNIPFCAGGYKEMVEACNLVKALCEDNIADNFTRGIEDINMLPLLSEDGSSVYVKNGDFEVIKLNSEGRAEAWLDFNSNSAEGFFDDILEGGFAGFDSANLDKLYRVASKRGTEDTNKCVKAMDDYLVLTGVSK